MWLKLTVEGSLETGTDRVAKIVVLSDMSYWIRGFFPRICWDTTNIKVVLLNGLEASIVVESCTMYGY